MGGGGFFACENFLCPAVQVKSADSTRVPTLVVGLGGEAFGFFASGLAGEEECFSKACRASLRNFSSLANRSAEASAAPAASGVFFELQRRLSE